MRPVCVLPLTNPWPASSATPWQQHAPSVYHAMPPVQCLVHSLPAKCIHKPPPGLLQKAMLPRMCSPAASSRNGAAAAGSVTCLGGGSRHGPCARARGRPHHRARCSAAVDHKAAQAGQPSLSSAHRAAASASRPWARPARAASGARSAAMASAGRSCARRAGLSLPRPQRGCCVLRGQWHACFGGAGMPQLHSTDTQADGCIRV